MSLMKLLNVSVFWDSLRYVQSVSQIHIFYLFFYFWVNSFFSELLYAAPLLSEVHWELLAWFCMVKQSLEVVRGSSELPHTWVVCWEGEGALKSPSPSLRAEPRTSPSTRTTPLTFLPRYKHLLLSTHHIWNATCISSIRFNTPMTKVFCIMSKQLYTFSEIHY